ncbi:hypothetical protein GGX14DRAFT_651153 [Mycena pura]|uniref:Uncharacterized protein n=1 Tax=Mycena pura TaxID=153505 RepID=A0AAD6YP27_9AGAR|nr:hypothetical protein GGX14DRAFT_651153 [Mycena pura]
MSASPSDPESDSLPLIDRNLKPCSNPPSSSLLKTHLTSGLDWPLFYLFANGVITFLWGIALAVFAAGKVPIAWGLSQYGQQHASTTSVAVTAISTLSTTHLKFTIQRAAEQYAAAMLCEGITLRQWEWMEGVAQSSTRPPFKFKEQPVRWLSWLLLFCSMAGHSASLTAILQPESFFDHRLYNDSIPCAVPASDLSFHLPMPDDAQRQLDDAVMSMGLQLYTFYEQVAGNTTMAVVGRVFTRDRYGYGAIGGLVNGLQEVPGVEFDVSCSDSGSSPSLASLWSNAGIPFPAVNLGNGTGSFETSLKSNSTLRIVTTGRSDNLMFTLDSISSVAFFSVVQLNGDGALLTVDANGSTIGCTWSAIPRLVHIQMVNFTAAALPDETFVDKANSNPDLTLYPAPIGRAVLGTLRGMAHAILYGARISPRTVAKSQIGTVYHFPHAPPIPFGSLPSMPTMLAVLLADGAKAAFTAYSDVTHASVCGSNNRTVQLHWRFGNLRGLGFLAIILNIGFGGIAMSVVYVVAGGPPWRKRKRAKGVAALKVVDAFKLGVTGGRTTREMVAGDVHILRVTEGQVVLH